MNPNQIQQGDVLLTRVDKLPEGANLVKNDPRGVVLAEGEATGHFHGIKTKRGVKLHRVDDLLFLENRTKKPVVIEHQEHKPVTVEPGIWQIGQVREWDYLNDMARRVID